MPHSMEIQNELVEKSCQSLSTKLRSIQSQVSVILQRFEETNQRMLTSTASSVVVKEEQRSRI
jgi:hypothetical protein